MDDSPLGSLMELVAEVVARLGAVSAVEATSGVEHVEYQRSSRSFAVVSLGALEVKLQPEVAAAAARTSHTSRSSRGPDWVRFEPPELDNFAADRAEAWFLSAWRAAA